MSDKGVRQLEKAVQFARLLAAIDLEGYLTDRQYDSLIVELGIGRGEINTIFEEAHEVIKSS